MIIKIIIETNFRLRLFMFKNNRTKDQNYIVSQFQRVTSMQIHERLARDKQSSIHSKRGAGEVETKLAE